MKGIINIYDSIGSWGINSKQILSTLDNYKSQNITEIDVFINSPGGSVFEGFAIFNLFRDFKVNTFVNGIAASIASVIALAGDTLRIYKNSYLMIHNPWSIAIGDHNDMNETGETLESIRDTLIDLYKSKTGMSEEELKDFCDKNTFLSSQKALELGFADEVIENYPSQKFVAFYSDVLDNDNNLVSLDDDDLTAQLFDLEEKVKVLIINRDSLKEKNNILAADNLSLIGELETSNAEITLLKENIEKAESKKFSYDFAEFVLALDAKFEAGVLPPYVNKAFKDLLDSLAADEKNNETINSKFISLLSFLVDLNLLNGDNFVAPPTIDHSEFANENVSKESFLLYDKIMALSIKDEISFTNAFNKIKNGVE